MFTFTTLNFGSGLSESAQTLSNASTGLPNGHGIKSAIRQTDLRKTRVLVMAGHQEGIMAFGLDADEAGKRILSLMKEYNP